MTPKPWGCRVLLAAASGGLLILIYPPVGAVAVAWFALTPLLIALDGAAPLSGFFLGWLAGSIGALGVTGLWIFRAAHDYFQFSDVAAIAFTIAITQVYVAAYFGLFGVAVSLLRPIRWRVFLIPALFVATEYARAHLLSGCPWELLGHSQSALPLIQVCDLTGTYGVSFLLALMAAALARVRETRLPLCVAVGLVGAALGYGHWRVGTLAHQTAEAVRVGMVQANLSNAERGQPQHYVTHLERYLALSEEVLQHSPQLIIWPENAVGFFPETNPALVQRITDVLHAAPTVLLAGAPRAGGGGGVAVLHNSAYLISAEGIRATYDKRRLLPFVERLPLRLGKDPYLPGSAATIFTAGDVRFGVLICFEAIYPEMARELVSRGAQLLVNISNDSWFEAGAGPQQHYQIARFRAVENHISLVRVTNSGVSGAIDPAGREIARLPQRAEATTVVTVPLGPGGSFYARHGDVFAITCTGAALAGLMLRRRGTPPAGRA